MILNGPFLLAFVYLHFLDPAFGYVLKRQADGQPILAFDANMDDQPQQQISDKAFRNGFENVPPAAISNSNNDSSESDEDEDAGSPLRIRMFQPAAAEEEGKEETNSRRKVLTMRRRGEGSTALLDVDILSPAGERAKKEKEEEEEENNLVSQLMWERRELRRKPVVRGRGDGLAKGRADHKRKVKLPPRFSSNSTSRPTLDSAGGKGISDDKGTNGGEEESNKAMKKGRDFWVNALKSLLLDFRKMYPNLTRERSQQQKGEQTKVVDGNPIDKKQLMGENRVDQNDQ